jgi:hypothetical protein
MPIQFAPHDREDIKQSLDETQLIVLVCIRDRAIVHLIGGIIGYWSYHISTYPCANCQANEIVQPGVTEKAPAVSSLFVDNLSESILKTAVSLLLQALGRVALVFARNYS